jgi:hypothetical protein
MTLDAGGHAMDLYSIWYHGSTITHIDALCHYSFEDKLYNGFIRSEKINESGCGVLGVENQKQGIMTRAGGLAAHEECRVSGARHRSLSCRY